MLANMSLGSILSFEIEYDRPVWKEHGFSGALVCLGGGKQVEPNCRGLPVEMTWPRCEEKRAVIEGILSKNRKENDAYFLEHFPLTTLLIFFQPGTDAFNGALNWMPRA